MEDVIETLIELAESGTPVTLGSLVNTFERVSYLSCTYSGYYTFVNGVYVVKLELNITKYNIIYTLYHIIEMLNLMKILKQKMTLE